MERGTVWRVVWGSRPRRQPRNSAVEPDFVKILTKFFEKKFLPEHGLRLRHRRPIAPAGSVIQRRPGPDESAAFCRRQGPLVLRGGRPRRGRNRESPRHSFRHPVRGETGGQKPPTLMLTQAPMGPAVIDIRSSPAETALAAARPPPPLR